MKYLRISQFFTKFYHHQMVKYLAPFLPALVITNSHVTCCQVYYAFCCLLVLFHWIEKSIEFVYISCIFRALRVFIIIHDTRYKIHDVFLYRVYYPASQRPSIKLTLLQPGMSSVLQARHCSCNADFNKQLSTKGIYIYIRSIYILFQIKRRIRLA